MNIRNNIPKDTIELLPWFAINKLSERDQKVFEDALKTYPSLSEQIDAERELIKNISANKSVLHKRVVAAPEERLKVVFNNIDNPVVKRKPKCKINEIKKHKLNSILKMFINTTDSIFSSNNTATQVATFAGIGALMLSVAAINVMIIPSTNEKSDFTLASAETHSTTDQVSTNKPVGVKLMVGFNGSSKELSKLDVLKGKQIKIESPANKEGFFEISFKHTLNKDEITEILEGLLAHDEKIWFAGEAF